MTSAVRAAGHDVEPSQRQPLWRRAASAAFTALIVLAVIYLWPAPLGGATRFVIVNGDSMEPTYDFGDMVITRRGDTPEVGDAVVFAVPDGPAQGSLVIHRIHELGDDGLFVTQGDNRDTPDQWPLTAGDIVGEPIAHIPKAGLVVRFVQQLWVLSISMGLLVILLLWPSEHDNEAHIPTQIAADDITAPLPRPALDDFDDPEWSSIEIDASTMAEAEAWLEHELADIVQWSPDVRTRPRPRPAAHV